MVNRIPDPDEFKRAAQQESLWQSGDKLLVAVSGGLDSSVLAHFMADGEVEMTIAHCNFGLRGEESDRDELFVRELGAILHKAVIVEKLNAFEYAYKQKVYVEMAARELRYEWFADLIASGGYSGVVTGHHADDQIETVLLNLVRGTGISGLRGMLPKSGNVIRPFLRYSRKGIQMYAVAKSISWMEDSSNKSLEIRRNIIRHKIIPLLEELNPAFRETMYRFVDHLRESEIIFNKELSRTIDPMISTEDGVVKVNISDLLGLHPRSTYLFELLSRYGFSSPVADAVDKALEGQSGKQFTSPTHRLIKDREELLITCNRSRQHQDDWHYLIDEQETEIETPLPLRFSIHPTDAYQIFDNPFIAALDFSKLQFPLTLRRWQHGDWFCPLGMKNKKKLSDFFSDQKLSLVDKEQIWVLLSGEDIVYVLGYRIDHRFRITPKTREVFSVEVVQKH